MIEDLTFKEQIINTSLASYEPESIKKAHNLHAYKNGMWPKESTIGNFPRGPVAGTCLHKILERIDFNNVDNQQEVLSIIKEELDRVNINNSFIESV